MPSPTTLLWGRNENYQRVDVDDAPVVTSSGLHVLPSARSGADQRTCVAQHQILLHAGRHHRPDERTDRSRCRR